MLRDEAEKYLGGYNCAELILNSCNDYYKLNIDKKALKMVSPFGGGMYRQRACGLLTGGAAAIGYIFAEDKPSENIKLEQMTKKWVDEFEKEFGHADCNMVIEKNLEEDEGCNGLMIKAAELLGKIIDDNIDK